MRKNSNFINSVKTAISGIINTFKTERNMRFHFVVGNLIILFAYFYGLTRFEWTVLILTITMVLFAELVNTAIEEATDTATIEFSETAKFAKDASAGAVLLMAVASIVIGCMLFLDISKIGATFIYIFSSPIRVIISFLIGILDILFLIFAGKREE